MQAVLLIGVQGAGKTTFYEQRFAQTHLHISRDAAGSSVREQQALDAAITAGKPFVVDNTNITCDRRAPYISAAKAAGYEVIGYFFDVSIRTAIARNNQRTGKARVPTPALLAAYKRLQRPSYEEGFDSLYAVGVSKDAIEVKPWE